MSIIKRYFKRLLMKNKAFLLDQVLSVKGLMALLMKNRNTGEKWTKEEKREIKRHLKNVSKMVPVIIVFLLPGGTIMLPFLAEVLDRRKTIRRPGTQMDEGHGPKQERTQSVQHPEGKHFHPGETKSSG